MKKLILIGAPIILLVSLLVYKLQNKPAEPIEINEQQTITSDTQQKRENGNNKNSRSNCLSEDCLAVEDLEYPVAELPEDVIEALHEAIKDEYNAYATYDVVINEFGSIRPFIMIIRGEEQHIASLKALYDKYGVEIPANPYEGNIEAPETVTEACNIGVEAEIANAKLYREVLLPTVSEYEDITAVFNNLMNASQTKHLPAFERCSDK